MKTYQVKPITPGAASQVCVAGWIAPSGVPTRIGNAAWSLPRFEGTRVPADSMKQRMALAPTTDIRGVVVFDDGVSGSRKWSPPV